MDSKRGLYVFKLFKALITRLLMFIEAQQNAFFIFRLLRLTFVWIFVCNYLSTDFYFLGSWLNRNINKSSLNIAVTHLSMKLVIQLSVFETLSILKCYCNYLEKKLQDSWVYHNQNVFKFKWSGHIFPVTSVVNFFALLKILLLLVNRTARFRVLTSHFLTRFTSVNRIAPVV